MNIVEEIYQRADRHAPALLAGDQEVTYGKLIELVDAAAAKLASQSAPRIALDCPNGVQHVVLALGILRAGKCLVPLASELAAPERERVIRDTGVGAILDGQGNLRSVAVGELNFDPAHLEAMTPAFIRFSSGTTGRSKGVVLSHESLLARVTAANHGLQIGPRDRIMWILPMAHHFAVSIMLYLLHGATTVIENSHLAEDVLGASLRSRATILYGAPFHHAQLAAEGSGLAWPSLRLAISTAASLPLVTAQAFLQRFHLPLTQGLGIIEAGLPLLNLQRAAEKPMSVGQPLPDYEVQVRAEGELFVRGPGMFDAYLTPWRARAEVCPGGWFQTGDLAQIDSDGDVQLLGRSHSVINVAGLKCFPEEVESVICELAGVRQARVSGRPNDRFGAVPVAEIVPADPANPPQTAALSAHCRKALARYKVPVEFRLVEKIPLTPSGKIRR